MQATSALWKTLATSGTAALIATAEVNGTPYELAQAPAVARAMLDGQSFVGNAVAATLQIALRTVDVLPKSAEVALSIQLTDGTDTTEAIPAGTYYISKRSTNPEAGVTTLLCYDAMLKGNAPYVPASVPSGGLPMSDAVAEIASAMGVAVDSRTTINTGADYVLTSFPAGMTMRDALAKIAAVHGGNWIITPANALRLVPLVSSAGAGSATENVVDVIGVLGSLSVSPTVTISGFKWMLDGVEQLTGTDADIVLDLTSAPVTVGIAAALGTSLVGISYQPFSAPAAVYDPAAEIGDYVVRRVTVDDTTTTYVESVLCSEAANYSPACRAALSAPMPAEIADEYPFTGGAAKTLAQAEAYADEAVQALDTALTQEEVFNRLTDNGAAQGLYIDPNTGQIYVNASYIRSGTLILGGLNNESGVLEVHDENDNVIGTWDKDGVVSAGSIVLPADANTPGFLPGYSSELRLNGQNIAAQSQMWPIQLLYKWPTSRNLLPVMTAFTGSGVGVWQTNSTGSAYKTANDAELDDNSLIFTNRTGDSVINVQLPLIALIGEYSGQEFNNAFRHDGIWLRYGSSSTTWFRLLRDPASSNAATMDFTGNATVTGSLKANGAEVATVLASGTATLGNIAASARGSSTVSFASVGTSNYMVVLTPLVGEISCGAQNKTDTSFNLYYKNTDTVNTRVGTVNWAIIKLP